MTQWLGKPAYRSIKRLGWVVLTIALALPVAMGTLGFIDAIKAGALIVKTGLAWIFAVLIADLLTMKRDATSQENGRLAAAALALVVTLVGGYTGYRDIQRIATAKQALLEEFLAVTEQDASGTPTTIAQPGASASTPPVSSPSTARRARQPASDAYTTVMLLLKSKDLLKQIAEESAALDRQFDSVALDDVLAPQNLMSEEAIEASRKKLAAYRLLIAERGRWLDRQFAAIEEVIREFSPSDRALRRQFEQGKAQTAQVYEELAAAQLASVTATEEFFSLARRQMGQISVRDGRLVFQDPSARDEYQQLSQRLQAAVDAESKIMASAEQIFQTSRQALLDSLR